MGDRYIVMSLERAYDLDVDGVHDYAWADHDWSSEYRQALVDALEMRIVYVDYSGDDPEDMYLDRRLRVFVRELNNAWASR